MSPSEPSERESQSPIWMSIAAIGGLVIFVAAVANPFDSLVLWTLMIVCGGFLLFAIYVLLVVMPYYLVAVRSRRCPECWEQALVCKVVSLSPPPSSGHRCTACGGLFRRRLFGRWETMAGG